MEIIYYNSGKVSVRTIMHKIGFKCAKKDGWKSLLERNDFVTLLRGFCHAVKNIFEFFTCMDKWLIIHLKSWHKKIASFSPTALKLKETSYVFANYFSTFFPEM